jgi:hypothetical protein
MTLEQLIAMAALFVAEPGEKIVPPNYAQLDDAGMRAFAQNYNVALSQAPGAFYLCNARTVIVRDTFNPDKLSDRGLMVHEMRHHWQCQHNRMAGDGCAREHDAYAVQIRWLRDQPQQPEGRAIASRLEQWLSTNPRLCR